MSVAAFSPTVWSDPDVIVGRLPMSTPIGIDQIELVLSLVRELEVVPAQVLNLGADSGLLTASILEEFPQSEACLIGPGSLAAPLRRHSDRIVRLTGPGGWSDRGANRKYQLVLGGPKMETMLAAQKRQLFAQLAECLGPGGCFLSVESIPSATRWTGTTPEDFRIRARFGNDTMPDLRASGVGIARRHHANVRDPDMTVAPLEIQLDWLRDLGFTDVECYLAVGEQVVYGGIRSNGSRTGGGTDILRAVTC